MKHLLFCSSTILKKSIPMFKTRILLSLSSLIIAAVLYKINQADAAKFFLTTQLVQMFVVASSRFFIGINIKSSSDEIDVMLKNYANLLITSILWGLILTAILFSFLIFYKNDSEIITMVQILAIGIIPISIYSLNCTILETIQKSYYTFFLNIIAVGIHIIFIFVFYAMLNNILLALTWALTASRVILALLSTASLFKYIKIIPINFAYMKSVISIGAHQSLSAMFNVSLMVLLIWFLAELLLVEEMAKLSLYFSVLNFIIITGSAAVTAITVNNELTKEIYLGISLMVISAYSLLYAILSPAISLLMFGEISYFGHIILCMLVVYFNLFSSSLVNRIRYINDLSKVAYLFNIPVVITLLTSFYFNISTALEIVLMFLFGEALVFLITFICYKKSLLTVTHYVTNNVLTED